MNQKWQQNFAELFIGKRFSRPVYDCKGKVLFSKGDFCFPETAAGFAIVLRQGIKTTKILDASGDSHDVIAAFYADSHGEGGVVYAYERIWLHDEFIHKTRQDFEALSPKPTKAKTSKEKTNPPLGPKKTTPNQFSLRNSVFPGVYLFDAERQAFSVIGVKKMAPLSCVSISAKIPYDGKDYPVDRIDDYAFSGCDSLVSIQLPEGIVSIGRFAFANCSALASVNIPNTLTQIGEGAFDGCIHLFDVVVGNRSALSISCGSSSYGAIALHARNVTRDQKRRVSVKDGFVIYDDHCLIAYLGDDDDVVIPKSITSLSSYAFSQSKVVRLEIPSSVTRIEDHCFDGCDCLTEIINHSACKIQAQPKHMNDFSDGPYRVVNDKTDSLIKNESGLIVFDGHRAVRYRGTASTFVLPPHIDAIGPRCFAENNALISFDCTNATIIDEFAFAQCYCLTMVRLSPETRAIKQGAFENCRAIVKVINPSPLPIKKGQLAHGNIALYAKELKRESPFEELPSRDGFILYDNRYLVRYVGNDEKVIIPDCVEEIGPGAFACCDTMKSIEIGNQVKVIGEYAFFKCTKLREVALSKEVEEIRKYAFCSCYSLRFIELPEHLKSVEDCCFDLCVSLNAICFPGPLEFIGWKAFNRCPIIKLFFKYSGSYRAVSDYFGSDKKAMPANCYFYAEEKPTKSGNFWHYVSGVPMSW